MSAPQEVLDALAQATRAATPRSTGEDVADAAVRGAYRGVTAIPGMVGDIADLLKLGGEYIGSRIGRMVVGEQPSRQTLTSQITGETPAEQPLPWYMRPAFGLLDFAPRTTGVRRVVEAALPQSVTANLNAEPTTAAGRYTQAAAEFVPAALAGPGGLIRRAVTGGLSGGAGEAASDAVGLLTTNPALREGARIVASLLTFGRLNRDIAQRQNPSTIVRDATRDVTPADWARAEERMAAARAEGVPLLPAEAMGTAGIPLQGLTSDIAATRHGGRIQRTIAERAPSIEAAATRTVDRLAPAMEPAEVSRNTAAAAREVTQEARRFRADNSGPFFETAATQTVGRPALDPIIRRLDDAIERAGPRTNLGQEIAQYRDDLIANMGDGASVRIGPVNQHYKEWRDGISPRSIVGQPTQAQREAAAVIGPINRELGDTLANMNSNIRMGRTIHQANSPRVNELRQPEILGNLQGELREGQRIAPELNRQLEVITGRIGPNGETIVAATPRTIGRVFDELATSSNPNAARDLAGVWLRHHIDQALRRTPSNVDATSAGVRLSTAFMGTSGQAARTEAVIRGMARANGSDPNGTWLGFRRLMDVLDQTGRIPATGSRTATRQQLAENLGSNWGSRTLDLVNLPRGSWARNASDALRARVADADYRTLADALASPEGLTILRQMAGQHPRSPQAQILAARLLGAGTQIGEAIRQHAPELLPR